MTGPSRTWHDRPNLGISHFGSAAPRQSHSLTNIAPASEPISSRSGGVALFR